VIHAVHKNQYQYLPAHFTIS